VKSREPWRRAPRNRRQHERSRAEGGRADRHRPHEGRRQGGATDDVYIFTAHVGGDLAIDADIASDIVPVHELAELLLAAAPSTRWMRDATRGGVGAVANELVKDSRSHSSRTSTVERISSSPSSTRMLPKSFTLHAVHCFYGLRNVRSNR
jgi:hypothetical protein